MHDLELTKGTRYLFELAEAMDKTFNLSEIKLLCFGLHEVDYENLAGENEIKLIKIQSLIFYLGRRGRLHELRQLLIEQRPRIEWPEIPNSKEKIRKDIKSIEPESLRPDGRLVAGLGTVLVFVICGWLGASQTVGSGVGIMYPLCVPIFGFLAIFGFLMGRHYKSKRAKVLSFALGIASSFHIIFLLVLALLIVLASVIFGRDAVGQFITELSLRYGN